MSMVRRTVTLDADAVDAAMQLAGGNFSAYVNEALLRRVRADRLAALVEEDSDRRGAVDERAVGEVTDELRRLDPS